ncbi:exodeoxyribonuclease VII small subunit [Cellulosimicrobium sp. I38E]|uniref:exodeoxyribonuclease VII small subunit n=1 Tax=Cellulosimicrobium sp. I38E TaxID=1393139 RepID=UPI0007B2CD32|nr:exodeoxyribonuclease VII small subunit [Cellulosimicrobium sp. I38E]
MGLNTAVTSFDNAVTPDVATLSYEQARDELVQVVARLEAGGEPLEASLALWERGEALAARCQEWLDGARARLDAARAPQGRTHDEPDETPDDTTGDDR